jgi:hypothetical protein
MAAVPGVFPLWQIALDAGVAFLGSVILVVLLNRRSKAVSALEALWVGLVVGLSVLAWRSFANVALLNNDPIPPVSPNDALSPIVTYVALGWYAAFRVPRDTTAWARERALLSWLAFVVNVVVI